MDIEQVVEKRKDRCKGAMPVRDIRHIVALAVVVAVVVAVDKLDEPADKAVAVHNN